MRRSTVVITALALAATSITPLTAQQRQRDRGIVEVAPESVRHGFYIGAGLGAGRETFKFSDETSFTDGLTKPTISIRLGGTPNRSLRLGGELFAWANEVDDGTESFSAFLLSGQFYPMPESGLFLKAGGGFGRSGIDFTNGSSTFETGFAWNVGGGADVALSRSVGIGPIIDFYSASFTRRNEPTLTERVLNLGVQVTFQTGGRGR